MNEQQLRERFDALDVPPTGLQIDAIVGSGRRRVRRRRALQVGGGVALAVGLLAAVPGLVPGLGRSAAIDPADGGKKETIRCAGTLLPVPAGLSAVEARMIDPTGRYIVGNDHSAPERTDPQTQKSADVQFTKPVLWTDGQAQALPMPAKAVLATAVNAGGVVAAVGGADEWTSVIRYTGGVPTMMIPPPGKWIFDASPTINKAGDILINARHKGAPEGAARAVLLWKAGSTTATQIPLPKGAEGLDLTDGGSIIGDIISGPQIDQIVPYVWDEHGKGHQISVPAGQNAAIQSAQGDWVIGGLWPSGAVGRWNLSTGQVRVWDIHGPANAVNGKGWVIGSGEILRDDATVKLDKINGIAGEPLDLSDTGVVIGSILTDDGAGAAKSAGPITWRCGR
jgi:hypothetical protein